MMYIAGSRARSLRSLQLEFLTRKSGIPVSQAPSEVQRRGTVTCVYIYRLNIAFLSGIEGPWTAPHFCQGCRHQSLAPSSTQGTWPGGYDPWFGRSVSVPCWSSGTRTTPEPLVLLIDGSELISYNYFGKGRIIPCYLQDELLSKWACVEEEAPMAKVSWGQVTFFMDCYLWLSNNKRMCFVTHRWASKGRFSSGELGPQGFPSPLHIGLVFNS